MRGCVRNLNTVILLCDFDELLAMQLRLSLSLCECSLLTYYRELLRLKIKELGEEHLSVGKVMNNLAVLYCLQVSQ